MGSLQPDHGLKISVLKCRATAGASGAGKATTRRNGWLIRLMESINNICSRKKKTANFAVGSSRGEYSRIVSVHRILDSVEELPQFLDAIEAPNVFPVLDLAAGFKVAGLFRFPSRFVHMVRAGLVGSSIYGLANENHDYRLQLIGRPSIPVKTASRRYTMKRKKRRRRSVHGSNQHH